MNEIADLFPFVTSLSPEMLTIAYIYVRLLKRKETKVLTISRVVSEVKVGSGGWIIMASIRQMYL